MGGQTRYGLGVTYTIDDCVSILNEAVSAVLGEAQLAPLPGHDAMANKRVEVAYS